jgi:hypothetical protein
LVTRLGTEIDRLVLKSIANLVSVIAGHEFTHGQWPALSQFILSNCQSANTIQKEVGMMTLSCVMESASFQLHSQYSHLFNLFSSALENTDSKMIPYYALKSLTYMVEYLNEQDMPQFSHIIPKVLQAITALISIDEDKACDSLELIDELMECEITLISPYLRLLVEFCLKIGGDVSLDNTTRVKTLSILGFLVTVKKKSLVSLGLLPVIVEAILTIMVANMENRIDEREDLLSNDDENHSPSTEASKVGFGCAHSFM